jgi:hypothetical protein
MCGACQEVTHGPWCAGAYRSAIAMSDVQKSSPDHPDARVVVHVEERQLLPVLSAEDDEQGVEEIQEFRKVMNVNKIFHTSGVGRVDSENVEALGQEGDHCQTPDHVHVEQDLCDVVYLRWTGSRSVNRRKLHKEGKLTSAPKTSVTVAQNLYAFSVSAPDSDISWCMGGMQPLVRSGFGRG